MNGPRNTNFKVDENTNLTIKYSTASEYIAAIHK